MNLFNIVTKLFLNMNEEKQCSCVAEMDMPFGSLFKNENLSDVTLCVGHKSFKTHKLVLAANSTVFESMLYRSEWKETKESELVLEEESDAEKVFGNFLQYLYTGKIDLPPEDIFPIVCLADKYDVVHLKTFCQEKLKKSLKQCPDMSTMITWCKCAMQRDLNDLKEFCLQFIANNICILISSVDNWLTLETDILFELLKRDDIVVDNEFILVEALEKWLEHPVRAGHIRENVSKVLQLIRFPMIHPRHLASLEMSDINISFGDLCGPFIMDAYRFHAVPLVHRRMDNLSPNSVPRNYTGRDNNISTNIRVDGFRDLKKMDSQLASLLQTAITSSFADSNGTQRLCFNLDFYPKGYFKTVKRGSRFGSKVLEENSQTTLILGWSNVLGKASVEANVLVYAYQDGQRYVAYSLKSRRDLTSENPSIIFQNVVDLKELSRMDSPYLMNGSFEIRVILRLLEYEHRQDEIHHRSESKR